MGDMTRSRQIEAEVGRLRSSLFVRRNSQQQCNIFSSTKDAPGVQGSRKRL